MPNKRSSESLSDEELRRLLVEKRREERQARLEHYRRTGRVIRISPEPEEPTLESLRSNEAVEELPPEEKVPRRKKRRPFIDHFLLLIEAAAVIGLIAVLIVGMHLLSTLNHEVSSALIEPTLTPTPLVSAVVLPSGHTPPGQGSDVQFNEAEIPENLRPLVQSLANLPVPTKGPEQAQRIQIQAINVDAPIVQGDGWEQLKKGVGQHIGSANPGQSGNVVLSAHDDVYGEIFKQLDQLKVGDKIIIFTSQVTYTYIVSDTQIVPPTEVEVMAPTQNPTLTLISCYPYRVDTKRIVVSASLLTSP